MTYASVFREDLFGGRVFLVTGGGSGIGRCTAHELANLGATVALLGRDETKLLNVQSELKKIAPATSIHICDIREEERVKEVVAEVLSEHQRLDGLVNNAGGQYPSPLKDISAKGFDAVVRTNLMGGFLMARECYTQHFADAGGAIVNIVADMWHGMPGMGHSGAARAGMVNLTETAALEWASSHTRVNAVAPGFIASSGMDTYPEWMHEHIRSLAKGIPMKRLGTESEVSAAICFLLSDAARFMTGTTLRVDGGAINARSHWPNPDHEGAPSFDAFTLSEMPKVLQNPKVDSEKS